MALNGNNIEDLKTDLLRRIQALGHTEAGTVVLGQSTKWSRSRRHVNFNIEYTQKPVVQLSVLRIDANNDHNLRYNCQVDSVSLTGFDFTCETWSTSKFYDFHLHWLSVSRLSGAHLTLPVELPPALGAPRLN